MGTSVGTRVFNAHGWRAAAALSVGWQGFCLLVILIRGPHCHRYTWFGYEGGYSVRKPPLTPPSGTLGDPEKGTETAAVNVANQERNEDEVGKYAEEA